MESKQGGGEVTTDRVPGRCNHEKCIMRTISERYLYSVCDFEGKDNNVRCRMDGFCTYMPLKEVYRIVSVDKMRSADSLCRMYILTNDLNDAIWIEHTTSGLDKLFSFHPSMCVAYSFDLDSEEVNRDEPLASVENMHVDVAFDEIIRQLGINFNRREYSYRALCGLGDRDGI